MSSALCIGPWPPEECKVALWNLEGQWDGSEDKDDCNQVKQPEFNSWDPPDERREPSLQIVL